MLMRIEPARGALFAAFLFLAVSAQAAPSFQRVLIVTLENANYESAIEQPFLRTLDAIHLAAAASMRASSGWRRRPWP